MIGNTELVPVFVAAGRLGFSAGFLDLTRRAGYGPPYVVVNGKILYSWPAVAKWAKDRKLPFSDANGDS